RKRMAKTEYKSIRLFKSDFWESFSHITPITPLIFWTPVCVFLLSKSQMNNALSLQENFNVAVVALLVWSLTEYTMHRFLFHYEAKGPMGKRFIYLFHGIHHDDPQDPTRLVFPILPAVLLMIPIFSFFKAVVPDRFLFSFTAYFLMGYLCYDYIHYATHHWPMKGPIGKFLRTYHLKHHHGEKGLRYGVSNPLWDLVFGTYLSPYSKKKQDKR
ncbi:MAG: sterol desaturase family protein, partial [Bdellovibrionota bacterium]|nr:sterol desaturase family protein [Bdellovibrionota bacterium]